jgi:hypothetical protein
MKTRQLLLLVALSIVGGVFATYSWFSFGFFIPFSERLWSFFNGLMQPAPPGVASDLEILSVFLIGALMTGAILLAAKKLLRRR